MSHQKIFSFDFPEGKILAGKYVIEQKLGDGWEGEVYKVSEIKTSIPRTVKFYFPVRNQGGRTAVRYSQKLNRLSNCRIIMKYAHQDWITYRRHRIEFLVSEFIEGTQLSEFLKTQPGRRFHHYEALVLMDALCRGMETVHNLGEYHGDIHSDNIMVQKQGIGYRVKLIDFYELTGTRRENIFADVVDLVRVLYELVGGRKHYSKMPPQIKSICCGLKSSLIRKKFRTAGELRRALHQLEW